METINQRINDEVCYETINKLKDEALLPVYMESDSVKSNINKLETILDKHVSIDTKKTIIKEYLSELIPAGTKGVIRGNTFNNIIKDYITNIELDEEQYEVKFESKCDKFLTSEIPDWYILHKSKNKILIGMNQLDLWSGGHQLNRGFKYLENNKHNTENSKLLCVICNHIEFKKTTNKAYKLFQIGYEKNTLCYIKNLKNIIRLYFA